MRRILLRNGRARRGLVFLLLGALMIQSVSCGSLLYPERIGQPRGPLDPKVVALDTAGLLLFVAPGLISFAVDFYNGTIYMPQGPYVSDRSESETTIEGGLVSVSVDPSELRADRLEETVARVTGRRVDLSSGDVRRIPLERIGDFEAVVRAQNAD